MIVERVWNKRKGCDIYTYKGYYLFGIIPLYIKVISID